MVNVPARHVAAAALRRFAAGLSSVEEFERDVEDLDDDATVAFFGYAWLHYDDFKTERLAGRWRLTGAARKDWARWALYLAADDAPYPWRSGPTRAWVEWIPLRGLIRFFLGVHLEADYGPTGRYAKHWPFRDRARLREAERRYLARFKG